MENTARNQEIKYMEEISLNAWPSYRIELYDGWLLRYSHNYTYRTNSVEQIGESTIPVSEKISYWAENVEAGKHWAKFNDPDQGTIFEVRF